MSYCNLWIALTWGRRGNSRNSHFQKSRTRPQNTAYFLKIQLLFWCLQFLLLLYNSVLDHENLECTFRYQELLSKNIFFTGKNVLLSQVHISNCSFKNYFKLVNISEAWSTICESLLFLDFRYVISSSVDGQGFISNSKTSCLFC